METTHPINDSAPAVAKPKLASDSAGLKAKGACWYCNHPLDNVRRFCGKACADDYRTEEEVFRST